MDINAKVAREREAMRQREMARKRDEEKAARLREDQLRQQALVNEQLAALAHKFITWARLSGIGPSTVYTIWTKKRFSYGDVPIKGWPLYTIYEETQDYDPRSTGVRHVVLAIRTTGEIQWFGDHYPYSYYHKITPEYIETLIV